MNTYPTTEIVKAIRSILNDIKNSKENYSPETIKMVEDVVSKVEPPPAIEKKHQNEIFEYIGKNINGKRIKTGVILGFNDNGTIRIGWSKCNIKMDKFSREAGLELARNRARNETPTVHTVPNGLRKQVRQFGARCVRYFKDAHKLEMPA